MIYSDLKDSNDISGIINTVKREFRNLAKLTLSESYESMMGPKKVLTIYHNLQPAMKIEGYEDLLDLFKEVLEKEKQNYHSGS